MANTFYFTNKRSFNYVMIPETEWKNSGYVPRTFGLDTENLQTIEIIPPNVLNINVPTFTPGWLTNGTGTYWSALGTKMANGYNNNALSSDDVSAFVFNGATKTSMWYYFNEKDIDTQLGYLKSVGINSIRVFLDIFCWAGFKNLFLSRLQKFSEICDSYKIRTEYVMFDGISADENITDLINSTHNTALAIPNSAAGNIVNVVEPGVTTSVKNMIIWGLLGWRKSPCPGSVLEFHPSSMVVSGDQYLTDVYRSVSSYQSTHIFDILNEGPPNSEDFNLSAINKMKSLLQGNQKGHILTQGFAALDAVSGPWGYYFSSVINDIAPLLDVVTLHPYGNFTYANKYIAYTNGIVELALSAGKPITANEGCYPPWFGYVHNETSGWNKLGFSFSHWDAMADRPLGNEAFLAKNGLFFPDGQVRSSKDVDELRTAAVNDGWLRNSQLNSVIVQKSGSTNVGIDGGYARDYVYNYTNNIANNTIPLSDTLKYHPFMVAGGSLSGEAQRYLAFRYLNSLIYNNANTCSAATNFTPYEGSVYSRIASQFLQTPADIGYDDYYSALITWSALPSLASYANDIDRNLEFVKRLEILNKLYLPFPPSKGAISKYGTVLENSKYDFRLVSNSSFLEASALDSLFNSPVSGADASMFIEKEIVGGNNYISSGLMLRRGFNPVGHVNPSATDKPLCYYNTRGGLSPSGSCFYKSNESVSTNKYTYQNVYSKLDWAVYNQKLFEFATAIRQLYKEFNDNLLAGNVPNLLIGKVPASKLNSIKPRSFFPLVF